MFLGFVLMCNLQNSAIDVTSCRPITSPVVYSTEENCEAGVASFLQSPRGQQIVSSTRIESIQCIRVIEASEGA